MDDKDLTPIFYGAKDINTLKQAIAQQYFKPEKNIEAFRLVIPGTETKRNIRFERDEQVKNLADNDVKTEIIIILTMKEC